MSKFLIIVQIHNDFLTYVTIFLHMRHSPSGQVVPQYADCLYSSDQQSTQTDQAPVDTVAHIVASCPSLSDIRDKILTEIEALVSSCASNIKFKDYLKSEQLLTQFILDPSSFNLERRIHINDPVLPQIFVLSRDLCYQLDKRRRAQLNSLAAKC